MEPSLSAKLSIVALLIWCASHDREINAATLAKPPAVQPVGLPNIGNSCFHNAALQLAYATPPIRDHFLTAHDPCKHLNLSHDPKSTTSLSHTLCAEVAELFYKMTAAHNERREVLEHKDVKASHRSICASLSEQGSEHVYPGDQADASDSFYKISTLLPHDVYFKWMGVTYRSGAKSTGQLRFIPIRQSQWHGEKTDIHKGAKVASKKAPLGYGTILETPPYIIFRSLGEPGKRNVDFHIKIAGQSYGCLGFIAHTPGHYTAYIRASKESDKHETWYHCDDSKVEKIGKKPALEAARNHSMVLVYEKYKSAAPLEQLALALENLQLK